jgi:hypothetical protein
LSAPAGEDAQGARQPIEVHPVCGGEAWAPHSDGRNIHAGGQTYCGDLRVEEAYVSSDLQVKQEFGIWDTVDFEEAQAPGTTGVVAVTNTNDVECSGQRDYRNDTFHWVLDAGQRYEGTGMDEELYLVC